MWLNIGSGPHPAPAPWINADVDPDAPGVEVVADVRSLPFADGEVERLYAGHVVEHLPPAQLRLALTEWRRVLAPDGVLMIVSPDVDRAVRLNEPHWLLEQIIAHGDGPDGHAWSCSEIVLLDILRTEGWIADSLPVSWVTPPTWPNPSDAAWQCAVHAVQP